MSRTVDRVLWCWIVAFLAITPAAAGANAPPPATPRVVTTTKPIHSLASLVMTGVAKPSLLVDGSASPHTFTLKPSQARELHEADVFVRVSEQIEPFTRKITTALGSNVRVVTLADTPGLSLLPLRKGGAFEAHAHDHHGHDDHSHHEAHGHDDHHHHDHDHGAKAAAKSDNVDGHIWLDPANAVTMVNAMANVLADRFPQHRDAFMTNARSTVARLQDVQAEITELLQPVAGKPFIVFHDATQYFESRFQVSAVGAITLSPDVKPGARRLTEVRRKVQELGAPCVFAEPGFQPKLLRAVMEGTSARSGTLDAEGLSVDAGPDAYFDILRGLAVSLKSCLTD